MDPVSQWMFTVFTSEFPYATAEPFKERNGHLQRIWNLGRAINTEFEEIFSPVCCAFDIHRTEPSNRSQFFSSTRVM